MVWVAETHGLRLSFVNAVRFGFNHELVHNNESVKALNPAAGDPSLGAFAGRDAAFVNVGGLNSMTGGVGGLPRYIYDWDSYPGNDEAFWINGTHSLKFGLAVEP